MFMIQHTAVGCLSLTGRDRLALIHRMSTNDVNRLSQGQAALTVLTTPIGRIIDLLTVLHRGEETLVITGAGRGEQIRNYFQRNIFFNDQVKVADVSATTRLLGIYGDSSTDLPLYHFTQKNGATILRVEGGLWLLGDEAVVKAGEEQFLADGVQWGNEAEFEIWRIEKGLPSVSGELTEDYIPLEAGLWHAVSFNKGCYTGQEIIARMESRGKLAKILVCLSAEHPIHSGDELWSEGAKVGTVTSVAEKNGQWIGLGYIKTTARETPLVTTKGQAVQVEKIAGTQRAE